MFNSNSDREWEKYGRDDPYFGVISHDKFRKNNLTNQNKEEFFESGSIYIKSVLDTAKQHIDSTFVIKRALDFGCGTGRLVIPLSILAEEVTGIDVSESMLNEARKNCEERSIRNASFVKSDDNLSSLNGKYDFIHSFIVFQHIPVARGDKIFKQLVDHLQPGGVCVVHFTYARPSKNRKIALFIKKYIPLSENFANLINGREFFTPQMQMNSYDLNHMFSMLQQVNISNIFTTFTDHGGTLGVVLYFKKPNMA